MLLQSISSALGGAVALISGRPLADIDRVFAPWQPFAAGGHGAEVRGSSGTRLHQPDADQLDHVRQDLEDAVGELAGAWVEDKGYGFALHYREGPPARGRGRAARAPSCGGVRRHAGGAAGGLRPGTAARGLRQGPGARRADGPATVPRPPPGRGRATTAPTSSPSPRRTGTGGSRCWWVPVTIPSRSTGSPIPRRCVDG